MYLFVKVSCLVLMLIFLLQGAFLVVKPEEITLFDIVKTVYLIFGVVVLLVVEIILFFE